VKKLKSKSGYMEEKKAAGVFTSKEEESEEDQKNDRIKGGKMTMCDTHDGPSRKVRDGL